MLDSSKLTDFADDNFNFDENCRNVFKQVENTVWEMEKLLVTSNFSFLIVFSKTCTADR